MKKLVLILVLLTSSSSYALLPYLDLGIGYERQMTSAGSWNAYGAELDIGIDLMFMLGAELYFGMLYSNSFNNHDMHMGLRGKISAFDLAFAKAGLGMQMGSIGGVMDYNLEVLGSVGVGLPIMPLINGTIEVKYRHIFSTMAVNSFGVYAGLNFAF